MADEILIYISAALDLQGEREMLGRAIAEVPVSLGWRIVQSPSGDEPADLDAVARADVHLLLLGSDIRAPIGLEWIAARRARRWPVLFLKQAVLRTPAAQSFQRYMEEQATWQLYRSVAELRIRVLKLLADHISERAQHYALSPVELAHLAAWRSGLGAPGSRVDEATRGGTGESGIVLSPERYVPAEGVLIEAAEPGESTSAAEEP